MISLRHCLWQAEENKPQVCQSNCFILLIFLCHIKENENKGEKTSRFLTCGHNLIFCLKNKKQSSLFPETEKNETSVLKRAREKGILKRFLISFA